MLDSLYPVAFFLDGLLQLSCPLVMLSLDLFDSCIKPTWYDVFQDDLFEPFTLIFPGIFNDIHDPID